MMLFSFLLQANSQAPSPLVQFAPFIVIIAIFYFLLIMPMQKQKKAQAKMLSDLKSGDAVITTGGVIGTITSLDSDTITLRVKPDNLKLQFARSAVTALFNKDASSEGSR